jgi:NADH dehydrogenase [ubiquinone] 1 alpha subcomplex assembly factor 3
MISNHDVQPALLRERESVFLDRNHTIPTGKMLRTQLLRLSRPTSSRCFSATRPAQSLTNIFDTADRPSLTIAKLTPKGFHLSDDLVVPGGLVLAGYQALLWDVDPPKGDGSAGIDAAWSGWTKERFQVFESVVPRPGT